MSLKIRIESWNQGLVTQVATIPSIVNNLDLSYNSLRYLLTTQVEKLLSAIPYHVTSVDLSSNDLGNQAASTIRFNLVKSIASIPRHIDTVILHNNNLGKLGGDKLVCVFSKFPRGLMDLDLSQNNFNLIKEEKLARAFGELPSALTTINLSSNAFHFSDREALAEAFSKIPNNIKVVKLRGNFLGFRISAQKLGSMLARLPCSTINLDLSANDLGELHDLKYVFANFPPNLIEINLSGNRASNGSSGVLIGALIESLPALPASIKIINLSHNSLGEASRFCYKLSKLFSKFPEHVMDINLSANRLAANKAQIKELIHAFSMFPATLASLNLSDNYLYNLTGEELGALIVALPAGITTVNLNNNKLEEYNKADLMLVFEKLRLKGVNSVGSDFQDRYDRYTGRINLIQANSIFSKRLKGQFLNYERGHASMLGLVDEFIANKEQINENNINKQKKAVTAMYLEANNNQDEKTEEQKEVVFGQVAYHVSENIINTLQINGFFKNNEKQIKIPEDKSIQDLKRSFQ